MSRKLGLRGLRKKRKDDEIDALFEFEAWNQYLEEEDEEKLREMIDQCLEEGDEHDSSFKETKPPKKQIKASKASAKRSSKRSKEKHPFRSTKLLQVDEEGRLPLHLALSHATVSPALVLKMMAHHQLAQAKIATRNDKKLPLHLAVENGHHMDVVKEVTLPYENALRERDSEGKTPISLATQVASQKSKPPKQAYCWGVDDTTRKWQKRQRKKWATVKWLLEEFAKLAANPFARLDIKDEEEENMLIDAITCYAPPPVVSLLVEENAERLSTDSAFAWSAQSLCIAGHYPLETLQSIAKVCPDSLGSAKDEMGLGLVGLQFTVGCFEHVEGSDDWFPREDRLFAIERSLESKTNRRRWDDEMLDWWEKVKYLVIFCGQCPEVEDSALCDALSNPDTPPLVIELLLALEPEGGVARSWEHIMPIVLAASTRTYVQKYHEIRKIRANSTIEMIVDLKFERDAYCRYKGRLPVHYAIECGKSWTEIKPIVSGKRRTVRSRDPLTKLYPFQLAATRVQLNDDDMEWITLKVKNQQKISAWNELLIEDQQRDVEEAAEKESLSRLRTVYELLRRSPTTLVTATRKTKPSKQLRDSSGMGMVGAHFTLWCFRDMNRVFVPDYDKIDSLLDVIEQGHFESGSSQIKDWWENAKFWIWYCFAGEIGTIPKEGTMVMPRDDEYLLHAALSNSDTPPQIIHLLLNLYPEASSLPLPGTGAVPLHLASSEGSYLPRRHEYESFPEATTMDLVLNSNPLLVSRKSNGRLPLHLAIESGKNWNEIEGLVVAAERTLAIKDPVTGFFPFQLSAMHKAIKPEQRRQFQWAAHNSVSDKEWKNASTLLRNKMIRAEQAKYQRDKLTTIYQLILVRPDLLSCSDPSTDEPEVIVIKKRRSTVIHFDPINSDEVTEELSVINERLNQIQEDEVALMETIAITAAAAKAISGTDSPDDNRSQKQEEEADLDPTDGECDSRSPIAGESVTSFDQDEAERAQNWGSVNEEENNDIGQKFVDEEKEEERSLTQREVEALALGGVVERTVLPEKEEAQARDQEEQAEGQAEDQAETELYSEPLRGVVDTKGHDGAQAVGAMTALGLESIEQLNEEKEREDSKVQKKNKKAKGKSKKAKKEKKAKLESNSKGQESKAVQAAAMQTQLKNPIPSQREAMSNLEAAQALQDTTTTNIQETAPKALDASPTIIGLKTAPEPSPTTSNLKTAPNAPEASPTTFDLQVAPKASPATSIPKPVPKAPGAPPTTNNLRMTPEASPETSNLKPAPGASQTTNNLKPAPKAPRAPPTFGYYDSSKVQQMWLKSEEEEEERVYRLRRGWSTSRRNRRQVNHFTAHAVDKNLPCLTCDEGKREALILPCRHLCVCRRCSVKASLKSCPLCDNPVKSTTVIHL
jgi:hypothetical protein